MLLIYIIILTVYSFRIIIVIIIYFNLKIKQYNIINAVINI
jgi:hypothetical protein